MSIPKAPSFALCMTTFRAERKVQEGTQQGMRTTRTSLVHLPPSFSREKIPPQTPLTFHTGACRSGLGHVAMSDDTRPRGLELSWFRVFALSNMAT